MNEPHPFDIIATLPCSPLKRIRQLETEMENAKGELQALALYLSAGMGNDDDPISKFVERIKFGVNEFSNGLERLVEAKAERILQLEEALLLYEEKARDCRKLTPEGQNARSWLHADGGETARCALEAKP